METEGHWVAAATPRGGLWTAGGSTIDLVDNRSRSVLIMIIRTDGLPVRINAVVSLASDESEK